MKNKLTQNEIEELGRQDATERGQLQLDQHNQWVTIAHEQNTLLSRLFRYTCYVLILPVLLVILASAGIIFLLSALPSYLTSLYASYAQTDCR